MLNLGYEVHIPFVSGPCEATCTKGRIRPTDIRATMHLQVRALDL